MIILFAPAKTLDITTNLLPVSYTYTAESNQLIEEIQSMSETSLKDFYGISDNLFKDVQNYIKHFDEPIGHKVLTLYRGEAYKSLDAHSLSKEAINYLNQHLFILDALYGLLHPSDVIRPYRLDFLFKGINLKQFWRKKINDHLISFDKKTILSLASKEYSSLIDPKLNPFYEVQFYNLIKGKYKAVSMYNKHHRGLLLRHIAEHQIKTIEELPKVFYGYQKYVNGYQIEYRKD
ncbi:MAG: YaaA family protein [Acholeplasma sp.]|nr:YaaA family protein [Acholeplasma sp.]